MTILLARRAFTAGLLSTAALAACSSPPPRPRYPDLTYAHLGQFRLDVARLEIVSEYRAPMNAPNIEHQFPVIPENALRRWAQDRLTVTGTQGRYGRFVIQDASVTDTLLPRTEGVRGAFTTDQTDRYDGTLAVTLEVREERGNFRAGDASARVTRSRTVPEGLSVSDRERIWFEFTETMMNDINAELERQIRSNLQRYVA